jgi:hypothetical protein
MPKEHLYAEFEVSRCAGGRKIPGKRRRGIGILRWPLRRVATRTGRAGPGMVAETAGDYRVRGKQLKMAEAGKYTWNLPDLDHLQDNAVIHHDERGLFPGGYVD